LRGSWGHLFTVAAWWRCSGISVATRREGKFIFCTLADEAVLDLMSALRRIAEQNIAEVERVP